MIIYSSKSQLELFSLEGSVLLHALPRGIVAAIITLVLHMWYRDDVTDTLIHPYACSTFVVAIGFLLVFRMRICYQRYWEGKTRLETMSSKWADCAAQAIVLDEAYAATEDYERLKRRGLLEERVNLMSKPGEDGDPHSTRNSTEAAELGQVDDGAAAAGGKRMGRRNSIRGFDPVKDAPIKAEGHPNAKQEKPGAAGDSGAGASTHGCSKIKTVMRGAQFVNRTLKHTPSTSGSESASVSRQNSSLNPITTAGAGAAEEASGGTQAASTTNAGWHISEPTIAAVADNETARAAGAGDDGSAGGASTTEDVAVLPISPGPRKPGAKFGRTKPVQHRESHASISDAYARVYDLGLDGAAAAQRIAPQAAVAALVKASQDGVGGEVSVAAMMEAFEKEGYVNGEHRSFRRRIVHIVSMIHAIAIITLKSGRSEDLDVIDGVSDYEIDEVINSLDPVYICIMRIQRTLIERMEEGGLPVPAPIISRMFQEISNGMLGYNQARKIVETPFPFPYAQLVALFLHIITFLVPYIMVAFLEYPGTAVAMAILTTVAYDALDQTARELQDPFGDDPNDLPLVMLHEQFNQRLLVLLLDTEQRISRRLRARVRREAHEAAAILASATQHAHNHDGASQLGAAHCAASAPSAPIANRAIPLDTMGSLARRKRTAKATAGRMQLAGRGGGVELRQLSVGEARAGEDDVTVFEPLESGKTLSVNGASRAGSATLPEGLRGSEVEARGSTGTGASGSPAAPPRGRFGTLSRRAPAAPPPASRVPARATEPDTPPPTMSEPMFRSRALWTNAVANRGLLRDTIGTASHADVRPGLIRSEVDEDNVVFLPEAEPTSRASARAWQAPEI